MSYYIYKVDTGEIVGEIRGSILPDDVPDGCSVVLRADGVTSGQFYVIDGELMPLPPRPSDLHEWTATGWQLIGGALGTAKAAKNAEINASRLAANQSYFEFSGKQITADPLSRGDIDAVNGYISLTGQMPPNWIGAWKTADNSWIPVADVATWTDFYSAMLNQGSVNFAKAQTLKAAVIAAQSIAELEAIKWD